MFLSFIVISEEKNAAGQTKQDTSGFLDSTELQIFQFVSLLFC